ASSWRTPVRFLRRPGSSWVRSLLPLESSFLPAVDEGERERRDETEHREEPRRPERPKLHRPGVNEDRLHVEDHEEDRGQVELHRELHVAARRLAAALVEDHL